MIDRLRFLRWWSALNGSFWFIPSLLCALTVAAAVGLVFLDYTQFRVAYSSLPWMYDAGPQEARSMLSTIATSVMTVAGTTFSITIAALTLASEQFGPRRLRSFMADRGTQVVLGTFCGTFLFCLIVLRSIHGPGEHTFVPHVSATVGLLLAFASVGVLIYFVHHLATTLQVEHLIDDNAGELSGVVRRLFVEGPTNDDPAEPGSPGGEPRSIRSGAEGYVELADISALLAVACEHELDIEVAAPPGHFIARGEPLLAVRSARTASLSPGVLRRLHETMHLSIRRTTTQDPLFAVQQLVEIAVRALSPGINAPYTATICIDRLSGVLVELTRRHMPGHYRDAAGHVRVRMQPVTFEEMVDVSFADIRRYGAASTVTIVSLLEALGRVGRVARDAEQRAVLRAEIVMTAEAGEESRSEDDQRAVLRERQRALDALDLCHDGLLPLSAG